MVEKFSKIIIDMNNYFHRHYYICNNYDKDNVYRETGRKVFEGVQAIERKYGTSSTKVYCTFDNHNSKMNLRAELSDDYKKNREEKPPKFYETLEQVKSMLLSYKENYRIVYADYLEADDLVLPLIESFKPNQSVLLISEDEDWARLIQYKDREIYWLAKKRIFNKEIYQEHFGYEPSLNSVVLFKTVCGDKSDGISPGLPNLKKEIVYKICKDFVDVYDLIQNAYKVDYISDHYKKMIKAKSSDLVRNFKLVSFISLPDMKESISNNIYKASFKEQTLKLFYKSFGIDIKKDLRILIKENPNLFHLDTLPRK